MGGREMILILQIVVALLIVCVVLGWVDSR